MARGCDDGYSMVMGRYAEQCRQVGKIISNASKVDDLNNFVRCQGTQPSRPDGLGHEECRHVMPIDRAYKCLYCGFWFCTTCAEKHFGKTREEHRETLKEAGEYHGML